jgi:hypothetical protein
MRLSLSSRSRASFKTVASSYVLISSVPSLESWGGYTTPHIKLKVCYSYVKCVTHVFIPARQTYRLFSNLTPVTTRQESC